MLLKEFIELNVNTETMIKTKKTKNCGIKCKGYECFLEYTNFKNSLIKYEFWCYNKDY